MNDIDGMMDDMDAEIKKRLVEGLAGTHRGEAAVRRVAKKIIVDVIDKYRTLGLPVDEDSIDEVAGEYASEVCSNIMSIAGGVQ